MKNRIAALIALVVAMVLGYNAVAATNEANTRLQNAAKTYQQQLEEL